MAITEVIPGRPGAWKPSAASPTTTFAGASSSYPITSMSRSSPISSAKSNNTGLPLNEAAEKPSWISCMSASCVHTAVPSTVPASSSLGTSGKRRLRVVTPQIDVR